MNPVQYIILNKALGMSTGKAAAQAAHASQMGLLTHVDNDTRESPYCKSIVNLWMRGGHYAKVVLETTDDLGVVANYLAARGFKSYTVIDEGRTELDGLTRTAIGTGVVDKDDGHTRAVFGAFKLYSDSDPSDEEVMKRAGELRELLKRRNPDREPGKEARDDDDPTGALEGQGVISEGYAKRLIDDMFRRTRDRCVEPPFPWPPTVRQT